MDMIEVSTIDYLPGYRITKSLGIVFSSKIMNQAIASDNTNIEEMLDTARQEAMAETVAQASRRHASAIINVRFTTTNLGNNMIECQVLEWQLRRKKSMNKYLVKTDSTLMEFY